jgi:ATP-dependent RNA helicase SUPV3L1/SUV3
VKAFVDDEAGTDVAEKVQRRLQHFIDRKVAALFEPLVNIQRDETLTGLARGFGFRLVEALGIIDRRDVAAEVKELDQDARSMLRKHGIRFGQFTVFLPALLKPAPTRLRLVLWSLVRNLDEFPESPPPGLVTIPSIPDIDTQIYLMSGYKPAGERAIRIDMLERLADMLRGEDSRGGFEAKPDMLSITGMTLDQFANLMEGLGYKAEKGERPKARQVTAGTSEAEASEAPAEIEAGEAHAGAEGASEADAVPDAEVERVEADTAGASEAEATEAPADLETGEAEMEVFYTFTWGGNRGGQHQNRGRPQGQKPKPRGKGKPRPKQDGGQKQRQFEARPPRKEKAIDPDNPFAQALMGLRDKKS